LLVSLPVRAQSDGEVVRPANRDVTPAGATQGPTGSGPLIREPVPPPPADPARWRRFFLPETPAAGAFKADKLTIRISGLAPPPADQTCKLPGGEEWPCGRTALVSFRLFLRGRAVECYFPRPEGVEDIIAPCRVGKTDLALWLLGQGWAKPDNNATEEYRAVSRKAECGGRGLWRGDAKPTNC
jgi:endonuclease YncB( thermonuclease family)